MTLCLQQGVPSTSNGPQNLLVVPVSSTSNGPQNLPVIPPNVRKLPATTFTVENRPQIGDATPVDSTLDETSGIDFAQIKYEGMYVMLIL